MLRASTAASAGFTLEADDDKKTRPKMQRDRACVLALLTGSCCLIALLWVWTSPREPPEPPLSLSCVCDRLQIGRTERAACSAAIRSGRPPEELIFKAEVAPSITQTVLAVLPFLPPPRILALGSSAASSSFDCSSFCACSGASQLPSPTSVERLTTCPLHARWRLVDVDGNETRQRAVQEAAADVTAWELPAGEHFSAPTQYFLPRRAFGLLRTPLWDASQMTPPVRRLLAGLEANIGAIRDEYAAMIAAHPPVIASGSKWSAGSLGSKSLGDHRSVDGWMVHDVSPEPNGPTLTLSSLLAEAGDEVARCPVCSAFFSRVEGDGAIQPHRGPVNHRLRVQLALDTGTPLLDKCGMRVGSRRIGWVAGTALVFDDSFEHEVWCRLPPNRSRNLLIFDVWHPHLTFAQRLAVGTSCDASLTKRPYTVATRRALRPVTFASSAAVATAAGSAANDPACVPSGGNSSEVLPMLRSDLGRTGSIDVALPFQSQRMVVRLAIRGFMSNFHGAAKGSAVVVEGGRRDGGPLILCASDFGVLWALTFQGQIVWSFGTLTSHQGIHATPAGACIHTYTHTHIHTHMPLQQVRRITSTGKHADATALP